MLKKLRIQNFKVWEDTGEIDLAPITLFFGANSSGKSSIGQFLMMLKQTVESRGRDVFYLGERNSAVQLGSYQEMVFQRDVERDIEFEYQWSSNDESPIIKFTSTSSMSDRDKTFSGNDLAFQAKVGRSPTTHLPRVELFNYELIENGESQLSFRMKRRPGLDSYETKSDDLTLKMRRRFTTQLPYDVPDHFYRFPRTLITRCQDAEILREFNYKHEELFSALFYLGPLRSKAQRSYLPTGGTPESVGYEGEDTVAAILAARARDKIYEKNENRFERRIASKLRDIGLIEDFKVEELSERSYEVKVRTKGSTTWVELPDVGFGISQVLPVLVQCFYAPEGSIVLIDQPEIHLHPYAQSALADVMIDVIKKEISSWSLKPIPSIFFGDCKGELLKTSCLKTKYSAYFANINNLVPLDEVEPKISERILNQLKDRGIESANDLVRVSSRTLLEVSGIGEVKANELQENAKKNLEARRAKLESLDIDEFGNIRNWPENFFGDEMGDITAQAKAAMEKRMQQHTPNLERTK